MGIKRNLFFIPLFVPFSLFAQVGTRVVNNDIIISSNGADYHFTPAFVIVSQDDDPHMSLKSAGIPKVSYSVLTWKVKDLGDFKQEKVGADVGGDGLDDRILRAAQENRTANVYHVGKRIELLANGVKRTKDTIFFKFPMHKDFQFKAFLVLKGTGSPVLHYNFKPQKEGYYSIGYVGAPAVTTNAIKEIWQPLIWQEKRIPGQSYLTPAYMAPIPTALYNDGKNSVGVMASSKYIPFQPLPTLDNSQFGISLINQTGKVQPQVFAPIPGGFKSLMKAGQSFNFSMMFIIEPMGITQTYQHLAESVFGFKDYRHNDIASLNTVLDNIRDYSLSKYAWFIDSLKGCAYATDVPGAVKNVSSLNPLELAIVMDDSTMFEKRAYPLMEFMLSREKFLFSLDSTQKIQSPSRKLKGPAAPLSELIALYNVFGKENNFLLELAKKEFTRNRIRNLDENEKGYNWMNAMYLFKATRDSSFLKTSITLAKSYLNQRVDKLQEDFNNDPLQGQHFFWPAYTNKWIQLLELYECTGDPSFLKAAEKGAREYTMFTWMSPTIPNDSITVNKDGKAPMYWYLKSKGHHQMYYPEEKVPAWRLSEMGLTAESSGTATGHRAIFMANYAPWLLRLSYYTKDVFLKNVAKAAIIGRYRNFPGYHINTERTSAYEKLDFPLHEHIEQSVNSFHYNHILPMASMLLDYMVTDGFVRSGGQIDFPSEYIEGYAYLQNKMYGTAKGNFYAEKDVQLWMPSKLLKSSNIELNYISARKGKTLFLAFTNQSKQDVETTVSINPSLVKINKNTKLKSYTPSNKTMTMDGNSFRVSVPANGLTAVALQDVDLRLGIQQQLTQNIMDKSPDYLHIKPGRTHAMLFKLGTYGRRLFIYLEDDDTIWKQAILHYKNDKGNWQKVIKNEYPFEFTVKETSTQPISFSLELINIKGEKTLTDQFELGQNTTN